MGAFTRRDGTHAVTSSISDLTTRVSSFLGQAKKHTHCATDSGVGFWFGRAACFSTQAPQIKAVPREKPETPATKSYCRAAYTVRTSREHPVARATRVPGSQVTLPQRRQHIPTPGRAGRGGDSPFLRPAYRAVGATGVFCFQDTVPQRRRGQFASGKSGRGLNTPIWHTSLTPKPSPADAMIATQAPRLPHGAAVALRSTFTTTATHAPTAPTFPTCGSVAATRAVLTATAKTNHLRERRWRKRAERSGLRGRALKYSYQGMTALLPSHPRK